MLSTPLYTDQPCLSKGFNNDPNNSYNSNMPKHTFVNGTIIKELYHL